MSLAAMRLVGGLCVLGVVAGCGSSEDASLSASEATAEVVASVAVAGVPEGCEQPSVSTGEGATLDFAGLVLIGNDIGSVAVRDLVWSADPSQGALPSSGYLSLQGVDVDSGDARTLLVPAGCEDAERYAGVMRPGATLTVLTKAPSDLQEGVGLLDPIGLVVWVDKDWNQPVYGATAAELEEFALYAKTVTVNPFDLISEWVRAEDREALGGAYNEWAADFPWYNTDPFIRSLSPGDMPADVVESSTVFEGQVSYGSEVLVALAADPSNRVVVRTDDGVLGAAAVANVGEFQWRSQLLGSSSTVSVWITNKGDLTGGTRVAELRLTDAQRVDGAQILITVTSMTSATIEPVK